LSVAGWSGGHGRALYQLAIKTWPVLCDALA
jgi:hypothetical protein